MKVLEIAQKRLIQFVDKMEKLTEIVVDWMNLEYNLKVAEVVLKNLTAKQQKISLLFVETMDIFM